MKQRKNYGVNQHVVQVCIICTYIPSREPFVFFFYTRGCLPLQGVGTLLYCVHYAPRPDRKTRGIPYNGPIVWSDLPCHHLHNKLHGQGRDDDVQQQQHAVRSMQGTRKRAEPHSHHQPTRTSHPSDARCNLLHGTASCADERCSGSSSSSSSVASRRK